MPSTETTVAFNGYEPGRVKMAVRVVPTLRWRVRVRVALILLWLAARMIRAEMLSTIWEESGDDE